MYYAISSGFNIPLNSPDGSKFNMKDQQASFIDEFNKELSTYEESFKDELLKLKSIVIRKYICVNLNLSNLLDFCNENEQLWKDLNIYFDKFLQSHIVNYALKAEDKFEYVSNYEEVSITEDTKDNKQFKENCKILDRLRRDYEAPDERLDTSSCLDIEEEIESSFVGLEQTEISYSEDNYNEDQISTFSPDKWQGDLSEDPEVFEVEFSKIDELPIIIKEKQEELSLLKNDDPNYHSLQFAIDTLMEDLHHEEVGTKLGFSCTETRAAEDSDSDEDSDEDLDLLAKFAGAKFAGAKSKY